MRQVTRWVWLIPLAIHVGYFMAVANHLPLSLGADLQSIGTTKRIFVLEWFGMIGFANFAFFILHLKLPYLKDRHLKTPGSTYWLSSKEAKAELVDRLRGMCEMVLLSLNVFFLAVFQKIYQTNVVRPRLTFPGDILFWGFIKGSGDG